MNEKDSATKPATNKRPHSVEIADHRLLAVTGVLSVPTFTDRQIEIELEGERLYITGHGLEIKGLDLDGGKLTAAGDVSSLRYSSVIAPKSLLKKIFK